jgi:PRC-barrel domain
MGTENWIVKKSSGEEWGLIKRLIIDSATKQISYADVILGDTGRLIRLPWESFEMQNEWITLAIPEAEVNETAMRAFGPKPAKAMTMEVWP